jgi:uncharacterized membrane protein (UPF0127 family)
MPPRPDCSAGHALRGAFASVLLFLAGTAALAQDGPRLPLSAFPTERITVATRGARLLDYTAWRADTYRTREQGLMFVRDLPADRAMIFAYAPPQMVTMWMKNTYLPLDMLFVDEHGCVVTVAEDTEPLSLAPIRSSRPVVLVVELRGGTVASERISVGDRVLRPTIGWPRGGVVANPCTPAKPIR